jgi:hypothetical protein
MGTLTKDNPNARELTTEILDERLWWRALRLVIEFLRAKGVEGGRIEFGFVLDRDIAGKEQGRNQVLPVAELESFIRTGVDEGTIERKGSSDFVFYALGADLAFMLCKRCRLAFRFR